MIWILIATVIILILIAVLIMVLLDFKKTMDLLEKEEKEYCDLVLEYNKTKNEHRELQELAEGLPQIMSDIFEKGAQNDSN